MKANEALEKIYITPHFERRWFTKEIDDVTVEYTRTDAFIEKGCEWIRDNYLKYPSEDCADTTKFVRDFRKYMKGR